MSENTETAGFIASVATSPTPVPIVEEEQSDHKNEENSESSAAPGLGLSVTDEKESTHEPAAREGQKKHISKVDEHTGLKQVIEAVQWAIVFSCVLAYFVYLMDYYFDDERNVKKYAVSKNIKEMPAPFIYVEFYINGGNCRASLVLNDILDNYHLSEVNNTNISTKTLVEEHAESSWVAIAKEYDQFDGWIQLLYVPPKNMRLMVQSKNYIGVDVKCDDGYTTEVWYLIGHTGELLQHETAEQALDIFYYDCDRLFSGYEVRVTYEWYGFRNKLNDETDASDYFASTIESTFALLDPDIQSSITVSPNPSGRKTIFVTIEEISFWSVLSLVGGMFSVTSVLGVVTVYLIWGYSFHHQCPIPKRCKKFPGLAPKAQLGHVRETQLTSFAERYLQEYLARHVDPQIKKLYQKIADLENIGSKSKDQ